MTTDLRAKFSASLLSAPGAGVLTLLVLLGRGFGGLSERTLEHLTRARRAGSALTSDPDALVAALAAPSPGIDLLDGLLLAISPLWHAHTLWALGAVAGACCAALIFKMLHAVHGSRRVGALGAALFVINPVTLALGATPSATFPACALMLGTWWLGTHERLTGLRALALWGVGALWLLSWPWMLLWCALLLIVRMRAVASSTPWRGELGASWLGLGLLLAPVVVPLLATLAHPGFWPDPEAGWLSFLEASFLQGSSGVAMAGHWYGDGRLPVWAGAWWMISGVPIFVWGSALLGAAATLSGRLPARPMTLITLLLLGMAPWLVPHGHAGAIDALGLMLAPLSILAAPMVERGILWARARPEQRRSRVAMLCMGGIVLASALPIFTYAPHVGAWRSALVGGLKGAHERGEQSERELVLPLALVRDIASQPGASLYAPQLQAVLQEYQRAEQIPAILTLDPEQATHTLQQVPRPLEGRPEPVPTPIYEQRVFTPGAPLYIWSRR